MPEKCNYTISGAINEVLPAGDIFTKLATVSLNGRRVRSPHRTVGDIARPRQKKQVGRS